MRITMFGKGTFRNYVCTKGGGGVNYGQYCANYLGLKFTSRGGEKVKNLEICKRSLCTSPKVTGLVAQSLQRFSLVNSSSASRPS